MDKNNDSKFQEQEAPAKNHDNAFVQVGKNGEPVFPESDETKKDEPQHENTTTKLDNR